MRSLLVVCLLAHFPVATMTGTGSDQSQEPATLGESPMHLSRHQLLPKVFQQEAGMEVEQWELKPLL